jgi:hypothetical protein
MSRIVVRLAFATALALLGAGSVGFARASVLAAEAAGDAAFAPPAALALLGPINELGRNGWHCVPEQAAKAKDPHAAELPTDDGR